MSDTILNFSHENLQNKLKRLKEKYKNSKPNLLSQNNISCSFFVNDFKEIKSYTKEDGKWRE